MIASVWMVVFALASSPPALQGIDDVPRLPLPNDPALSTTALLKVVCDPALNVIVRSRAVRLLPLTMHAADRVVVDDELADLIGEEQAPLPTELAYQVALARFDIAATISPAAARALASASSSAPGAAVRQAAAYMWWRVGGDAGRAALQRCAGTDPDKRVRGACVGRLRARVSAPVTGDVPAVLEGSPDGDSSTPPGRQLQRSKHLPQPR
jgi:hypothetical protein